MTGDELKAEIIIELEAIAATLQELVSLRSDVESREPTIREKTAAASFMAQFYSGIENILKRISHYRRENLNRDVSRRESFQKAW